MPIIRIETHITVERKIVFNLSRSIDLHTLSTAQTNEEAIDVEPEETRYGVEFVDEYDTHMTLFDDDRLQIICGDFYIEYER